MELDPYQILGISYSANLKEIRMRFKELVLINHPDRGGHSESFDIIKRAYSYIFLYKKKQKKQLEKEQRTFDGYTSTRNFQNESLDREFSKLKINPNDKSLNNKKFNKIFEIHKTNDPDDRGYKSKRSKKRLDFEKIRKMKNEKNKKQQIVVFEEPNPIELTKENYKKLGLKYVKDFSQNIGKNGSQYCDFQKAYTEYDYNTMTNYRKDDFSLEEYQQKRSNINFEMNPQEKMKMKMKMKQELEMENRRQFIIQKNDDLMLKKFHSTNNYLK
jgi:curved DNA-binding protein CbpA